MAAIANSRCETCVKRWSYTRGQVRCNFRRSILFDTFSPIRKPSPQSCSSENKTAECYLKSESPALPRTLSQHRRAPSVRLHVRLITRIREVNKTISLVIRWFCVAATTGSKRHNRLNAEPKAARIVGQPVVGLLAKVNVLG